MRSMLDIISEYVSKGNRVIWEFVPSIPALLIAMERPIGPEEQIYRTQVCISMFDMVASRNPEGMIESYFKQMEHKMKEQEDM